MQTHESFGYAEMSKVHNAPDCHDYVQYNCRRPQDKAISQRPDAGSAKDKRYTDIVDNHRDDQSSRGRTLRITAREPAGHSQGEQSGPSHSRDDECGRRRQRRTKQKIH